jgi:hypothetical protein
MLLFEVLFYLCFRGLQIIVSLRMFGHKPDGWKVFSFTLLQVSSIVLCSYLLPNTALQFLCLSTTYLLFFVWIFQISLFPDGLACYLTTLALAALGETLFEPLLRIYSIPRVMSKEAFLALGGYEHGAYVPIILLALYFGFKDFRDQQNGSQQQSTGQKAVYWLSAYGVIGAAFFLAGPALNWTSTLCCSLFLAGCLYAMPLSFFMLHQYMTENERAGKSLKYQLKQNAIQKSAMKTLREDRHEFINDLTLISTYLQMGKIDEAMTCLNYTSAKLADRNNYASLPHDAWLTVLESKQKEAKHRRIEFQVNIEADPPSCFQEQRLLPKLIINLIDNAFNAVSKQSKPQVTLTWTVGPGGERILAVKNNGPEIPPLVGKKIFRGGVTTKPNSEGNHGWGLVICKDIAVELKGSLTYKSSPEETTFILTLPAMCAEPYSELVAN